MSVKKDNNNLQEDKKQISRRSFLKTTGVTAGAVGIASVSSVTPALAGEKTGSVITDFAVKEVDRPPYMDYPYEFDDSKYQRIGEDDTAFDNPELAEKEFGGQPWYFPYYETRARMAMEDIPGYTMLDKSLAEAAELSDMVGGNMMSWSPLIADVYLAEQLGKKYTNPEDNNRYVKKAAHVYGAGDCGVAAVNEKWFYSTSAGAYLDSYSSVTNQIPVIFTDEYDVPTITEEAKYIPKKMNRMIVIVIPMEGEIAKYTPSRLGDTTDALAYSKKVEIPSKLAEFIRGLGYNAIPMGNDMGLNIPCAIDAGLGELGRNGLLIHPKYGQLCKLTRVLTDMPISVDKPINFGAAEFCRTCMKCADSCPSDSISREKDPSYEVACPSNNPGMKKWYVNTWSCLTYWCNVNGACMNCMVVCPYSKPQTWIHDVVKGVSSKTSIFNSTFRVLDDALGYGKTLEDNEPTEWWEQEGHGTEWLKLK